MNDQPIRILLVEDDPGDARLLREMLADAGSMCSELVWSTQLDEAFQRLRAESFDVILLDLSNGQQLGTMIGDLLESTQAQTGKLTIEPQCLSLVEVIPETLRTPEASAAAKQLRLSADVHGFLPPVYADADRVRQILINLIENAIKVTPEHGEVEVQASVYQEVPAFVCVAVRDTGCGISPQGTHKIFERLYQEANASDASRKGLGLGLYICHELVAAHGGHIWVESQLGQGSTFFFTLPVFPLVELLSPIIKAHNWPTEGLVLITIEFCFQRRSLPTLMRETLLRQAWQVLQNCTLHECLVLLPRMASLEEHELFFGVACVDQHGAEQIVQQIRTRPELSSDLVGPDVEIQISTMTIETPPESQEFPEALVNTIASRIEGLKHRAV